MPAMHAAPLLPCLFDESWKYTWTLTETIPLLCRCRGHKLGKSQASVAQSRAAQLAAAVESKLRGSASACVQHKPAARRGQGLGWAARPHAAAQLQRRNCRVPAAAAVRMPALYQCAASSCSPCHGTRCFPMCSHVLALWTPPAMPSTRQLTPCLPVQNLCGKNICPGRGTSTCNCMTRLRLLPCWLLQADHSSSREALGGILSGRTVLTLAFDDMEMMVSKPVVLKLHEEQEAEQQTSQHALAWAMRN